MDITEAKNVIRALVTSSGRGYTMNNLMNDFKEETGITIPKYGFRSVTQFLKSLTDVIKVYGEPPCEYVSLVESCKSVHIASLIQRQRNGKSGLSKNKKGINKASSRRHYNEDSLCNANEIKKCYKLRDKAEFNNKPKHSNNDCDIPRCVKQNLKQLISKQSNGIWCCDLLDCYYKEFNSPLDFQEYGYRSLMEMVQGMKDVFRYVRPGSGDWLLFDASKPLRDEQSPCYELLEKDKNQQVSKICKSQIANACMNGIDLNELLISYIVKRCGVSDVDDIVTDMNESVWEVCKERDKWVLRYRHENTHATKNNSKDILSPTPDDDFFSDLFPYGAVRVNESYPEMDAKEKFQIGTTVEVYIGEVWSPAQFYVQLKECESMFKKLTDEIQTFYQCSGDKYKMPDATVRPNQVCVAVYTDPKGAEEWERALILNVVDKDNVYVRFVDYGSTGTVPKTRLRFLHRNFLELPVQVFRAAVANIKPFDGKNWSEKACSRFLRFVSKSSVMFEVINQDDEKLYGDIFHVKSAVNISDILVREKLAVHIEESNIEHQAAESSLSDKSQIEKLKEGRKKSCRPEVEVEALAFELLCHNKTVRNIAKFNLETGLRVARNKAWTHFNS